MSAFVSPPKKTTSPPDAREHENACGKGETVATELELMRQKAIPCEDRAEAGEVREARVGRQERG